MNTTTNSRKAGSKSSSSIKGKGQLFSSKADENRVGKCLRSPELKKMGAKSSSNKKKQAQTLQMLIQKMKTTNEELKFRLEKSKDVNVVEKYSKFFKCTKCEKTCKPALNKNKRLNVHPILGVLMCHDCQSYYGDGNFSMDSDGEDKYCRWCGEGGTLFSCSKCVCGFCDICIRRHFGNEYLRNVQKDDDWVCFFCNPKPLWDLRFISSVAEQVAKKNNGPLEKKESLTRKNPRNLRIDESSSDETESDLTTPTKTQNNKPEKRRAKIYTTSSDDSEEESTANARKKLKFTNNSEKDSPSGETKSISEINKFEAVKSLENILKLTEYQMGLGLDWSKKKFNKLKTVNDKTPVHKLRKECQKMKWFISVISSYLVGFCNSIDAVEKSLGEEVRVLDTSTSCINHLTYSNIIQFLGFVTNQVKTFSEKGITLQDLLQAELYEDANVLGFKKSSKSSSSPSACKKNHPHSSEPMDDDNSTVDWSDSKNNEDDCKSNSNSDNSTSDVRDCKSGKDESSKSTSKTDNKESTKETAVVLKDPSPEKDLLSGKSSPDFGQLKLDWRSSINGEDVQDILTILESA